MTRKTGGKAIFNHIWLELNKDDQIKFFHDG